MISQSVLMGNVTELVQGAEKGTSKKLKLRMIMVPNPNGLTETHEKIKDSVKTVAIICFPRIRPFSGLSLNHLHFFFVSVCRIYQHS